MPSSIDERRFPSKKVAPLREHRTEFLGFTLGGEAYGVALGEVREILKPPPVTEVPRASPQIMGIVSVRGLLVTVIDVRKRLRGHTSEPTRRSRILLVEGRGKEMIGLYVEEVMHVFRLADSDIEPAPAVLGNQVPEYVTAIGRSAATTLTLIDLEPILGRAAGAGDISHAT